MECLNTAWGLNYSMHVKEQPEVVKCSKFKAKWGVYVKITIRPDLAWFRMEQVDKDTIGLLSKHVYNIDQSMASRRGEKLAMYLNQKNLLVKDLRFYLGLFNGVTPPVAFGRIDERWEI